MCICAHMYVNAHVLECMHTCMWRPEVDSKSLPSMLSTISKVGVSQLSPEHTAAATVASLPALGSSASVF